VHALLPDDPHAFVARAQDATNAADVDWAMSAYGPTIELETFGDGLHETHRGTADVRRAVTIIYDWLAGMDARITKTLVTASGDVVVNMWAGHLLDGTKTTFGAEFWFFDETGHVIRNVLYQSMDPKPFRHPRTVTGLIVHPRLGLHYLSALRRASVRMRLPG
jgi:hypothetical protein